MIQSWQIAIPYMIQIQYQSWFRVYSELECLTGIDQEGSSIGIE